MSSSPRPFRALVAGSICVAALLTGCTGTDAGPTAAPSASTAPSSGASSPTTPTTSSAPSATSPSAAPSTPADAVIINVTIAGEQVSPNGQKINVARGQTVVLNVTSDADDEIHTHTGGDGYELEVKAGTPVTGKVVMTETGSFEVESHDLEKIIAILVVR